MAKTRSRNLSPSVTQVSHAFCDTCRRRKHRNNNYFSLSSSHLSQCHTPMRAQRSARMRGGCDTYGVTLLPIDHDPVVVDAFGKQARIARVKAEVPETHARIWGISPDAIEAVRPQGRCSLRKFRSHLDRLLSRHVRTRWPTSARRGLRERRSQPAARTRQVATRWPRAGGAKREGIRYFRVKMGSLGPREQSR